MKLVRTENSGKLCFVIAKLKKQGNSQIINGKSPDYSFTFAINFLKFMSRKRPAYFYAVVSVALVLFVLGFFGLMTLHGRKLVNLFKERVDIWLELNPTQSQADISTLIRRIQQQPFVKPQSVTLITKEQAAATMKEDLGDSSMLEDMPDLLRDVIRFNVKAEYLDTARLSEWRETLRSDTLVADLYFDAANTGNVSNNLRSIGLATLVLCILLVFAAVALIHNTIRLDLYSNRLLIKNQELVGASWSFIGKPYIRRGILNGLLSGLLAVLSLSLMVMWLHSVVPELEGLSDPNGVLMVMTALVFLGMLISGFSTWFVVNRFLKMRIDDLY